MSSMQGEFNYSICHEDGVFVARCLDVEVASDGKTAPEALASSGSLLRGSQVRLTARCTVRGPRMNSPNVKLVPESGYKSARSGGSEPNKDSNLSQVIGQR